MPLKRAGDGWVRIAFQPASYTVPASELERIRAHADWGSEDMLDMHDGIFSAYHEVSRFERDGKRWVVLVSPHEWAIEVELTRSKMGEVRALPPEEAWRLARAQDAKDPKFTIGVEGA